LRLPKLSEKVWITPKELSKYFQKVIWITGTDDYWESLHLLKRRILKLWKTSGPNFTHLYLKEVLRLVIRCLSGSPETKFLKGIMVKVDHTGLPTIIPLELRKLLLTFKDNQRVVVCILSCLSVFRVFPTSTKPKLGTIIDPFSGSSRSFERSALKLAIKDLLGNARLKMSPPVIIKLETTSPNAKKSAWGASIDALAFIDHPLTLVYWTKFMYYHRSFALIAWLFLIILSSFPIFIVLRLLGRLPKLNMGRLGVVYDQAGKARVVGITNWWNQVCLKPLHNALFNILEKIECDGTFDQIKPFKRLIGLNSNEKFYSFDLSAATDRLPVEIQRDILDILSPGLGHLWSDLLDHEWKSFPVKVKAHKVLRSTLKVKTIQLPGKDIKYSVGQPMGAYSSWAMLAISHHVIVRLAARDCGLRNFMDYCILGDDVVIRNSAVADRYYNLMKTLGVGINLSKSVNSFEFAEFAKNWAGPGINITPIGPGLTLRLIRDNTYVAAYVCEAWKLGLFDTFSHALTFINKLRFSYKSEFNNILWSCFGICSSFISMSGRDVSLSKEAILSYFSLVFEPLPILRCQLYNAYLAIIEKDIREASFKIDLEERNFYQTWWKVFSTKGFSLRLLEIWLKLLGPGFWIYALSYDKSREHLSSFVLPSYVKAEPRSKGMSIAYFDDDGNFVDPDQEDESSFGPSFQEIQELFSLDSTINISCIDWTKKAAIRVQATKRKQLIKELESTHLWGDWVFEEVAHEVAAHQSRARFPVVDDDEVN
jgi:hypothetical protein